ELIFACRELCAIDADRQNEPTERGISERLSSPSDEGFLRGVARISGRHGKEALWRTRGGHDREVREVERSHEGSFGGLLERAERSPCGDFVAPIHEVLGRARELRVEEKDERHRSTDEPSSGAA